MELLIGAEVSDQWSSSNCFATDNAPLSVICVCLLGVCNTFNGIALNYYTVVPDYAYIYILYLSLQNLFYCIFWLLDYKMASSSNESDYSRNI